MADRAKTVADNKKARRERDKNRKPSKKTAAGVAANKEARQAKDRARVEASLAPAK